MYPHEIVVETHGAWGGGGGGGGGAASNKAKAAVLANVCARLNLNLDR